MQFNILLVDNDQKSKQTITSLIGGRHVAVTPASTPEDGLACLEGGNFDLILLDIEGGGIDYFDMIYKFDIPIIVMAEQDNEELALSMLRRGAQDYLVKNGVLNPRGLRRIIMHAVERSAFVKHNIRPVSNREIIMTRDALREHRQEIRASISEIGAFNATVKKYRDTGAVNRGI